jgi:LytS/YehU family sensor histidine kinase
MTPLESELATVRAYLSIEKVRFQGKLNVEYDIDESIAISVPLLTIQPLVENAIRHGIMKRSECGTVRIIVRRGEKCTVIAVQDNGEGVPEWKLSRILGEPASTSGVGLKNIQRRLILYYGQGLEIQSAEGEGTTVTMRIPD